MYNFTPLPWRGGRVVDGICISNIAAFLSAYFFLAALLSLLDDNVEFLRSRFWGVLVELPLAFDAEVRGRGVLRNSFPDDVA